MTNTQREKWEDEFDDRFPNATYGLMFPSPEFSIEIKSFIKTLLTQTDQAAREDERAKNLAGLRALESTFDGIVLHDFERGQTAMIREVRALLTSKKS